MKWLFGEEKHNLKGGPSQAWRCTPLLPAPGRQWQADPGLHPGLPKETHSQETMTLKYLKSWLILIMFLGQ